MARAASAVHVTYNYTTDPSHRRVLSELQARTERFGRTQGPGGPGGAARGIPRARRGHSGRSPSRRHGATEPASTAATRRVSLRPALGHFGASAA